MSTNSSVQPIERILLLVVSPCYRALKSAARHYWPSIAQHPPQGEAVHMMDSLTTIQIRWAPNPSQGLRKFRYESATTYVSNPTGAGSDRCRPTGRMALDLLTHPLTDNGLTVILVRCGTTGNSVNCRRGCAAPPSLEDVRDSAGPRTMPPQLQESAGGCAPLTTDQCSKEARVPAPRSEGSGRKLLRPR